MRFFPDYPILDLRTYKYTDGPDNLEELKRLVNQADDAAVRKYLLIALRNLPWLAYQLESETAPADNLRTYLETRSDALSDSYQEDLSFASYRINRRKYRDSWDIEEGETDDWSEFFERFEFDFYSLVQRAYMEDPGVLYLDLLWRYAESLIKLVSDDNEWITEELFYGRITPGKFLQEKRETMSKERKEQLATWLVSKEDDPVFEEYPDWKKDFLLEDQY